MMRRLYLVAAFLSLLIAATAADFPGTSRTSDDPAEREGRLLATELLSLAPPEVTFYGVLRRIESSEGGRTELALRYAAKRLDAARWQGLYEARSDKKKGVERLTIIHAPGEPNVYHYTPDSETQPEARLSGAEANIPFAGSDYWLSDLGTEFLHWPEQRVVKHKITMRNGVACKVLESVNPDPAQGYARVLSWIGVETPALIYAEAYDRNRRRLKTFSLHGFKKIEGSWRATILEIHDARADSKSQIEFQFETRD